MRTSLIETQNIENHLLGGGEGVGRLVFQARTLLEPDLNARVDDQKIAYRYIREYRRLQLQEEIAELDRRMFNETR